MSDMPNLTVLPPAIAVDLLEVAWGVVANAGGGDWTKETEEWQAAAARWRDEYHDALRAVSTRYGIDGEGA